MVKTVVSIELPVDEKLYIKKNTLSSVSACDDASSNENLAVGATSIRDDKSNLKNLAL